MDCRLTLNSDETFLELLNACYLSGEKIHLLVDDGGMERVEGFLKTITGNISAPIIEVDGVGQITLDKIVAVNGIFRPEYGEC
jgi:hypothetical protein